MAFDFDRYIDAFNTGDEETMAERYFTEDVIIDGPDQRRVGRSEWVNLLKFSHDGVTERLEPVFVVQEGDNIMAQANAIFKATKDRPEFPVGPIKAGQELRVRFFAAYKLREGKIAHITLGWWPPGMREV